VTSNKVFGRWGEVFGDDIVAAAMIDRLVHHAEVIALKGDSYRLKDRDLGRVPTSGPAEELRSTVAKGDAPMQGRGPLSPTSGECAGVRTWALEKRTLNRPNGASREREVRC
jgi:hypothetical protein